MTFSSMATAFANAKVTKETGPLLDTALNSLVRYSHRGKSRLAKDWTAKLSYKTARYLASKGVALQ